jgi:hypothetical protein
MGCVNMDTRQLCHLMSNCNTNTCCHLIANSGTTAIRLFRFLSVVFLIRNYTVCDTIAANEEACVTM